VQFKAEAFHLTKSVFVPVSRGDELVGGCRIVKPGHAITGELGRNATEIFANPARAIQDFANTGSSPEDIVRFTRRYGVLRRNDRKWLEIVPGEEVADDYFMVHCGQWLQKQEEFRGEFEQHGRRDAGLAEKVSKRINPSVFVLPGRSGGFRLEVRPDDLWVRSGWHSSATQTAPANAKTPLVLRPTLSLPEKIRSIARKCAPAWSQTERGGPRKGHSGEQRN
jgi:hypothetical protein